MAKTRTPSRPRRKTSPAQGLLAASPGELVVRMYRQGLGDCFLLALPAEHDTTRYMLIDCGVHARQTDGPKRLAQVLESIAAATGGRLDVVVATHEHADHLSGFVQRGSPFLRNGIGIAELWLAWTEKRGDRQADLLRQKRGTARAVVEQALKRAREREGALGAAVARNLTTLLDFETPAGGSVDEPAVLGQIAARRGNASEATSVEALSFMETPGVAMSRKTQAKATANELALRLLAVTAGDARITYCEPGEVRTVDGVKGLRAYVLGPPRTDLLEKDKPTKVRGASEEDGGAYKEVYLTAVSANRALELSPQLGVDASADGGHLPSDWRYPFAGPFYRSCEPTAPAGRGRGRRWGTGRVPAATRRFVDARYFDPQDSWRRIDGDWLGSAEALALNLDSDTNNTSLVLAIEWSAPHAEPGSGQVLLFAADAQVGNWLSWRDQKYGPRKLTADHLMSRVILYKVGHHGSHNATIRRDPREASEADSIGAPFGLELMNDLIAMIPVDGDAVRKNMPGPWKMPYEPMYRRLREKARRRVLRSDLELAPLDARDEEPDLIPTSTEWTAVPGLRGVKWRRSADTFGTGTKGPLYYDVAFKQPE